MRGKFCANALGAGVHLDRRWSLAIATRLPPRPIPTATPAVRSVDAAEVASAVSLSPLLAEADSGARARVAQGNGHQSRRQDQDPWRELRGRQLTGRRRTRAALGADRAPHHPLRLRDRSPPYPNDPAQPPRTDLPQKDAARLCAARGERLCSELEWEYACKGAHGDAYASGDAWDPACTREPATCSSDTGVLGLGAIREWTASDVLPLEKDDRPLPAVRGAAPGADLDDHRCAHRAAVSASAHTKDLGFRCCTGAANTAAIPAPKLGATARKIALEPKQVAEIFATIPQLASVGSQIRYFNEPDDTATVLRRGKTAQGPPISKDSR